MVVVYEFGHFQLDVPERRLLRDGHIVPLRSKVFDTLCILVKNHGRLLRKEELMAQLWPDSVVEENNLDHNVSKLRQALGENGDQKFIQTVPRQGYRFVAEVKSAGEAVHDGPFLVPTPKREPPPPIQQEVRFFEARDATRIAYSVVGGGPVLVKAANWLNHLDFDLKSPVWQHWLPLLTQHHQVVRYDERGNGLSSWNVEDFSFEAWVRDFEQLIEELQLKKFSILGISQGAAVAVWYAAHHPERVERMVLVGSFARGWKHRPIPHEVERRNALMTLARLGWGKDNPAFRQMFTTMFMPDALPEHHHWFNDLQRVCTSPDNAVELMIAAGEIDVVDLLPKVKCPTLVMHCDGDEAVPIAEGRLVAARIPGAQFVELPSRNHNVIPSEPAWPIFVRHLGSFMGWDTKARRIH
ncbi:MAG: transcriptional regulator [Proteobacteria bacterium]|nr:MAG: transcriptional regulator [Pseudomonadota bacterium]